MIFDAGKIMLGLAAFAGLATAPAWYDAAGGKVGARPRLEVGTSEKRCVLPVEDMRATHMQLLYGWRDGVVRNGRRMTHTSDGKPIRMSLTGTCLGCHSRKAAFCDRCHDYAAVTLNCFGCHADSKGPEKDP
ncbi:MAG: sulfate reduction electron transfer complex DsrMKJOP subunit DsrJ [Polyangiaceae bacterium]|nr:sulfate reduction electron transfer complex DsrMKJOP subunit DsrJ [Polyangiaceae bacterium]